METEESTCRLACWNRNQNEGDNQLTKFRKSFPARSIETTLNRGCNPGRRDVSLANTGAEGEKATYYISHVIVRLEDKWRMEDRDLKVVSSRSTSRFESCVVGKRKGGKWILPGIEFTSILARIEARTVRSSRERDDRAVRFVGGNLTTCPIDRFV